jgi:hypothetical protein
MKRGRPPGSRKLPDEFYLDLRHLFDLRADEPPFLLIASANRRRWKQHISRMCRNIIDEGGVRWIDRKTNETVATIKTEAHLRRRVYEAWDQLKNLKLNIGSTVSWAPTTHSTGIDAPTMLAFKTANIKLEFGNTFSTGGIPRRTDLWVGKRKLSN